MNIGKLDRRLTLQARVLTQDAFGQEVETYPALATVFGAVAYRQGTETPSGSTTVATQRVEFTIRYRATLKATNRVVYDGTAYNITDVAEIGRRDGLRLTSYSRDDNGV